MSNSTTTDSSSTSSRFSLILLEPGEIYFEDYLVYYNELKSPFEDANILPRNNSASISSDPITKQLKGNLKICSKSIVFDPINLADPLIKFPFKSIEKIEKFSDIDENTDDFEDIYSSAKVNKSTISSKVKEKWFGISSKQIILCKKNNKIEPYTILKRENAQDMHYFQFIFTNVNDSLDLLCQLHRASTLEYEQEDLMLQLILKSRLTRDIKFDLHQLDDMLHEQIQFESIVNKINPLVANPGKIILTNMCLYFIPFNNLEQKLIKIKLKNIKYIIKRRYHLKKVGCEIIFNKIGHEENDSNLPDTSTNTKTLPFLYLTFEDETTRDLFYTRLAVEQQDKLVNLNEFTQENMLQKWRYGAISNFEYLMYLNNMADRSYNDLTQYPVFPWVLNDYTSEILDLNDPKSYRDLSRPVGALNEERLQRLRQRCKEMQASTTSFNSESTTGPIFLYGSHYSTPAFVLFYLVRMYPEWQLCLQNGRFDHPNRLFYSIADTWRNCLTIDSDVKELIPEFYDTTGVLERDYSIDIVNSKKSSELGSFLRNDLELDFGVRADGSRVNHVILPRWAKNSCTDFILKMRDALESSYVSENLHKWIDLIFGYKQRGDEALKADNLFYYLCYEGAVDLDSIKDYSERKSLEMQIQEFGQIPSQLFKNPHLPKSKLDPMTEPQFLNIDLKNEKEKSDTDFSSDRSLTKSKNLNFKNKNNSKKEDSLKKFNQSIDDPTNIFKINASNFHQLSVKFNIKLHSSQINDCLFIEQDPELNNYNEKSKQRHIPNNLIKNNNYLKEENEDRLEPLTKIRLPLICSVSNDNWIKIYSLEDRSLFRSHNVSNFSLSSVDCIQIKENTIDHFGFENLSLNDNENNDEEKPIIQKNNKIDFKRSASTKSNDSFFKTLLFLSCWDNSMYIYDMNYNRCIHTISNSHDDAISRVRLMSLRKNKNKKSKTLILTSSWDSSIKIWSSPSLTNKQSNENRDFIRTEYLSELGHDSAVIDFQLSRSYLASICEDGNLYLWKLNKLNENESNENSDDENEDDDDDDECSSNSKFIQEIDLNYENIFSFLYAIQSSTDMGKINDCKIIESNSNNVSTIAFCTSHGYIKILNIQTNSELFSLKINQPATTIHASINKLYYTLSYIITVDQSGFVYFIDLQQVNNNSTSLTSNDFQIDNLKTKISSFLSHTIKLGSSCLQTLCIYKDMIVCVGDSDGNLYFLSLIDI